MGKNCVGYAITTVDTIFQAKPLLSVLSAQAAELIALTKTCKLFKGTDVTIYTDSQYAFATVHVFCQQWKNRGFKTSSGKVVKHANLLKELLKAITLPKALAVCKCEAHTRGTDMITRGNAMADKAAKNVTETSIKTLISSSPDGDIILESAQSHAPAAENSCGLLKVRRKSTIFFYD